MPVLAALLGIAALFIVLLCFSIFWHSDPHPLAVTLVACCCAAVGCLYTSGYLMGWWA